MIELKIEIPDDLKQQMDELSMIDWTRVISAFVRERMFEWKKLHAIVDKSELTEDDAVVLSREINKSLAKKYKELLSTR